MNKGNNQVMLSNIEEKAICQDLEDLKCTSLLETC